MKLPDSAATSGKEWAKFNLNAPAQAAGLKSAFNASSGNPTLLLNYLKVSGPVSTVGTEDIDGVPTTHYHALVDLERYASALPADQRAQAEEGAQALKRFTGSSMQPMDVWIDSEQRVRRFSTETQLCSPEGRIGETISVNVFDFGPQPPVSPPAQAQTVDLTEQVRAGTAAAVKQLTC